MYSCTVCSCVGRHIKVVVDFRFERLEAPSLPSVDAYILYPIPDCSILSCPQAKKLTFLHVFHHATVVPMAWLWLHSSQSLQTVALLTNTFVHVVMYYYYYRSSIGSPPRWKKLVTNIQIVQFVFR